MPVFFLKIPSATHEQTTVAGLANKIISPFVKRIFLTWKETKKYFPPEKTILVGLPLRTEVFKNRRTKYQFEEKLPTILIIGGKQGAHIINQTVFAILEKILAKYNVIHQCGLSSLYNDYQKAKEIRAKLETKKRQRYRIEKYIFPEDIGSAFARADLVVSRAGAHTIYELLALGKPAILIPYPFLHQDEQGKNAKIVEKLGLGKIILQKNLAPNILYHSLTTMMAQLDKYEKVKKKAKKLVILEAGAKMVREIEKLGKIC